MGRSKVLIISVVCAVVAVVGLNANKLFDKTLTVDSLTENQQKEFDKVLEAKSNLEIAKKKIEEDAVLMQGVADNIASATNANSILEQSEKTLQIMEETLADAESQSKQMDAGYEQSQIGYDEPEIPSMEEVEELYQAYRDKQLGIANASEFINEEDYLMPPEVSANVEASTGITGSEVEELMNR